MRMLNSFTIMPEILEHENLDYAILSHRWGEIEISLQDLENLSEDKKNSEGYKKLENCCKQAYSDGWEYVWIDTCCIDKTSSADLSEAINSMYVLYRNAQVCYAYLADVPSGEDHQSEESSFRKSSWFTRGWTLQELLAPFSLVFFGKDWVEIGTKTSLLEVISQITGINSQVLLLNHPSEISIAQRMSWASKRNTTRLEDEAYCLMGMFGVNMPMLYGEGEKAFIRLQLEIIKLSDDHTIFAWAGAGNERGLLARSPKEFVDCGNTRQFRADAQSSPYSMTNKGLRIELPLIPLPKSFESGLFLAILNCQVGEDQSGRNCPLGIYLKRVQEQGHEKQRLRELSFNYVRVLTDQIIPVTDNFFFGEKSEVYIKEKDSSRFGLSQWMRPQEQFLFVIKTFPSPEHGFHLSKLNPNDLWKAREEGLRLTIGWSGTSGALMFRNDSEEEFVVTVGAYNHSVWFDVETDFGNESITEIQSSYYHGVRVNRLLRNLNLSRVTNSLPGGKSVFVAMRDGKILGRERYLVEISVN